MGKIWFISCPVCRRRFFATYMLKRFSGDFNAINYPISYGHSLGRYGTTIDERISWPNVREVPSTVFESLSIFIKRLLNNYLLIERLLYNNSYVDSYRIELYPEYVKTYANMSQAQFTEPYPEEANYTEAY